MTKRNIIGSLAAALVASFPAAAAQASPNGDQYGNPVQQETPPTVVKAVSPAATQQGSELPFTGLELGLIVAGGGAAAGAGLVLRRATRGRRQ